MHEMLYISAAARCECPKTQNAHNCVTAVRWLEACGFAYDATFMREKKVEYNHLLGICADDQTTYEMLLKQIKNDVARTFQNVNEFGEDNAD